MAGQWRDKRYVLYIPSEFENDPIMIINKLKQEKQNPLPTVQYNFYMEGVDLGYQMLSYYSC